jgi:hypothetical protein
MRLSARAIMEYGTEGRSSVDTPLSRKREHATFDEASRAILSILSDGEWHKSTAEIHEPLRPWVAEHMFGKVNKHYSIESRRVGGGQGSYFEWRLPS